MWTSHCEVKSSAVDLIYTHKKLKLSNLQYLGKQHYLTLTLTWETALSSFSFSAMKLFNPPPWNFLKLIERIEKSNKKSTPVWRFEWSVVDYPRLWICLDFAGAHSLLPPTPLLLLKSHFPYFSHPEYSISIPPEVPLCPTHTSQTFAGSKVPPHTC